MTMQSHYSLNIAHFVADTFTGRRFAHFARVDCGPDWAEALEKFEFFKALYVQNGTRAKLTLTYWKCQGETRMDCEVWGAVE